MSDSLQTFDHRSSAYERPVQNWVCGHVRDGKPCRIGPGRSGNCRASFECRPLRDGERWVCTRPAAAGGKCTQGPLPEGTCARAIPKCVPRRSQRARRGRSILWAVAVTLGFLVIVLQGPWLADFISPGPLALHHGEIADCGSCHDSFARGPAGWVPAAFAPADRLADSKQCLTCHEMGQDAFGPHSQPGENLAMLTRDLASAGIAGRPPLALKAAALFGAHNSESTGFECATCHSEHQGRTADQTAMENARCQSCHSVQFESFAEGHPPFDDYPFAQRTGIFFDHASHISRHFEKAGKEKAPTTCTDCHMPAQDRRMMLVQGFENSCAACHLEQIEGASQTGPKGLAFLVAPGLDLFELRARDIGIGTWPEFSEEKISPFMQALLAGDAALSADLDTLASLDLLDLTDASDEDLAAVERVAWGVKGLYADLLASGTAGMWGPLSEVFGREIDKDAMSRLSASIPRDVIRAAQAAWFPDLFPELQRHAGGEQVPIPDEADDSESDVAAAAVGGSGETAPDGDILEEEGDILSEDEGDILSEDEGDILSEDEGDILSEDEGDILSEDEGDILSEDEDDILSGDEDLDSNGESEAGVKVETLTEIDPEAWAALGGWYRRDFALYYKPIGHADRFLRVWLDYAGAAQAEPAERRQIDLFAMLANPDSPGRCIKCHSIDQEQDGQLNVNWYPARSAPAEQRSATIFSHTTHFSLLSEEGCLTCHNLAPEAAYAESYKQRDPLNYASNFRALDQSTCADCHIEQSAGDTCVLCHQYHVGTFQTHAVPTEMTATTQ